MVEPVEEYFQKIVKNEDFRGTFQTIGQENENIKAIGVLLEENSVMVLDQNYTRHYHDKKCMRVHVLTGSIPYKCYDWPLQRKLQKDYRILRLQDQLKVPIIVDVISGIEAIHVNEKSMTKEDVMNYLYGEYPLNSNFDIIYISKNFLPLNLDS